MALSDGNKEMGAMSTGPLELGKNLYLKQNLIELLEEQIRSLREKLSTAEGEHDAAQAKLQAGPCGKHPLAAHTSGNIEYRDGVSEPTTVCQWCADVADAAEPNMRLRTLCTNQRATLAKMNKKYESLKGGMRHELNDARDRLHAAERERDEARASASEMRKRLVVKSNDGKGHYCFICNNGEPLKDGDEPSWACTQDGTEKHAPNCPMANNPGQPLLDRLAALEAVREAAASVSRHPDTCKCVLCEALAAVPKEPTP